MKATRWGGPGVETASAIAAWADGTSIVASRDVVLRFRPDLSLEWERTVGTAVGTANALTLWDVAALPDDAYLVLGYFYGTATLGGGTPNAVTFSAPLGRNRLFVARFDREGALQWAIPFGGTEAPVELHFVARPDGSFVVAGSFTKTATFGGSSAVGAPAESTTTTLTSAGCYDLFLASYAADGKLDWVRRDGADSCDWADDVGFAPDGSIIVTGGFYSATLTLGSGESNETILDSAGGPDVLIARYTRSGTLLWATSAGGSGFDVGRRISVASDGGAVVVGDLACRSSIDSDASSCRGNGFVGRFSALGVSLDTSRAAIEAKDLETIGVETVADRDAVVFGTFTGAATFPSGQAFSSAGFKDGFLMRIAF